MTDAIIFALPQRAPKWLGSYGIFLTNRQGMSTAQRMQIDQVITQMQNSWSEFVQQHGKRKIELSDAEKKIKKQKTLQKKANDVDFWEAIIDNPDQDVYSRNFAKRKMEMLTEQNNKKSKQCNDSLQIVNNELTYLQEDQEEEESENKDSNSYEEVISNKEEDEEEQEQIIDEENNSKEKEENFDDTNNLKLSNKDISTAESRNIHFSVGLKPIKIITTPNRTKTLRQALNKKISQSSLQGMRQNFYRKIREIGIGDSDQVVQMFDKLYETLLEQNNALNSVETLIIDSLE